METEKEKKREINVTKEEGCLDEQNGGEGGEVYGREGEEPRFGLRRIGSIRSKSIHDLGIWKCLDMEYLDCNLHCHCMLHSH